MLAAAEKLNCRSNLLARSLATNLTHQAAVLVDDFENPHELPFLAKLTLGLQAEGLLAVLININTTTITSTQSSTPISARSMRSFCSGPLFVTRP